MKHLSSFLFFLTFALSACTFNGGANKKLIVLQVLDTQVTAQEFSQLLANHLKAFDATNAKNPATVQAAKEEVLHEFIVAAVIKKHAKDNQISVTDAELEETFNKIKSSYPNDLEFKESLAKSGHLVSEWRDQLRQSLLQKKIVLFIYNKQPKKSFSPEEIKKYYQSHASEYSRGPQVRISQIVVKTEEEAQRLQKLIKNGSYSFDHLAKKFSLSPDAKNGGDIGYIVKGVVPAFDTAFNMGIGQLSSVIKSAYGYHLLKVTAKRPASKKTLEQARPEIIKILEEQAQEEAFSTWFAEYIKDIKVEKNSKLIDSLKVQTQGAFE